MQNYVPAFIEQRRRAGEFSGEVEAAVLFVDVSGFTALTEAAFRLGDAGAETISRELQRLFGAMVGAVHENGGFIAGFAGDAFTAVFPADETPCRAASCAVRSGEEIAAFFKAHGVSRTRLGELTFAARCGVAMGRLLWGIPQTPENRAATWYFRGPVLEEACAWQQKAPRNSMACSPAAQACVEAAGEVAAAPSLGPAMSDPEVLSRYFPEEVLEAGRRAELRHVAPVFLRFEGETPHEKVAELFSRLVELCRRRRGVFHKFDFGDKGSTAIALFGAPTALEHAGEAAVAFACEALSEFEAAGVPCAAGAASGLCYVGAVGAAERNEWSCLGDAVNTAARLMSKAAVGEALVDERVRADASRAWEFQDRGAVQFKGKSSTTAVFAPLGRVQTSRGFVYRRPMLGRAEELARLEEFVAPILSKTPGFVGVCRLLGEPGIGKTRLAAALRAVLQERGVRWIHMTCDGLHRTGWGAVSGWLREFLGVSEGASTDPAARRRIEARYADLCGDVRVPEGTRRELERTISFVADLVECRWEGSLFDRLDDAKLRHDNRIIGVKELVRALAAISPVVIEVEDAHWIDPSTAEWLTAMTRNVAGLPLAILATSRFQDDGASPDLELAQGAAIVDMPLAPVAGVKFVQEMAASLLGAGTELERDTVAVVADKAKGNPFFTEQLILHLHETGELEPVVSAEPAVFGEEAAVAAGTLLRLRRGDTARLPASLGSLVTARLDRLSPEVRETVKHASVLGVRFLTRVLGELAKRSGVTKRSLAELLQECEWEGVLMPSDHG